MHADKTFPLQSIDLDVFVLFDDVRIVSGNLLVSIGQENRHDAP
ncbi:hypothetical protein [Salinicola avicenniae]|nr:MULTISPECIES: hypothetical protein [unclassified Salinicola]